MSKHINKLIDTVTTLSTCAQLSQLDDNLRNEVTWFLRDYRDNGKKVTSQSLARLEKTCEKITALQQQFRLFPDKLAPYADAFKKADAVCQATQTYKKHSSNKYAGFLISRRQRCSQQQSPRTTLTTPLLW